MTLTNHLLTGATLASILPLPVAIPLAFVSHFILDALPHFGFKTLDERKQHSRLFTATLALDAVVSVVIAIWLIANNHLIWLLAGSIAYSPDLVWIYRFTVQEKFGKLKPTHGNRITQFHRDIQKYERVWGFGVELVLAFVMVIVIWKQI